MFDLKLGLGHFDRAVIQCLRNLALLGREILHLAVLERAYRNNRQAWIDLDRRDCVPRRGAKEGLFEIGVGDAFVGADEAGAKLHPDGSHLEVGGDRLSAADTSGDEHRDFLRDMGQDFLAQHAGRHRADVAAGLHPLDHQRVGARPHQLLGQRQRGREDDQLGAMALDPLDRPAGRQAPGEDDVGDLMLRANIDQLIELGMHGDQIDAERLAGERLGSLDFLVEQLWRHGPAGDHAEPARVGNG